MVQKQKRKGSARQWIGHVPPDGKFWVRNAAGWAIYTRYRNAEWTAIKVVCLVPLPHKANFHLSWNGTRLARTSEAKALRVLASNITDWVQDEMRRWNKEGKAPPIRGAP